MKSFIYYIPWECKRKEGNTTGASSMFAVGMAGNVIWVMGMRA